MLSFEPKEHVLQDEQKEYNIKEVYYQYDLMIATSRK
jgi:hypothetical protein